MNALMMTELAMTELATVWSAALLGAADSEGGDLGLLLVLGPAGAGAVYFGLRRYYRNDHASHSFEGETRIQAQPPTGHDAKVDEVTGTKQSRIDGDNRSSHRERVERFE